MRVGLRDSYVPLLPQALVDELLRTLTTVPCLVARIGVDDARGVVTASGTTAEEPPDLGSSPRPLSREPNDDDRLAHALANRADDLVTGDEKFLALAESDVPCRIVLPAALPAVPEEAGLACPPQRSLPPPGLRRALRDGANAGGEAVDRLGAVEGA